MDRFKTEVLVVGGGTGGTAAALQAARRGAEVILVSELGWLGGMLTAAGVSAPDGNELNPWQTGLWGAFLQALMQRQPQGIDHGWVSFFNFDPAVGASIFADWAAALPNLRWITAQRPRAVIGSDPIRGVRFDACEIYADIVIDGTELGDVLALGEVPYRWGWETQSVWQEPSAPIDLSNLADPLAAIAQRYPVQAPTWVAVLQDFGHGAAAPAVAQPSGVEIAQFEGAWADIGPQRFLDYGRLPGDRFMLNWPIHGNDYGENLDQLIGSAAERQMWQQAALDHTQGFVHLIQQQLGRRYGLAQSLFPAQPHSIGGGGFALMPYYRESRRLQGITTVTETDLLPVSDGQVAPLPRNAQGEVSAIAIGNYPNDHHYPGHNYPLQPKSLRWGGRWTGTPFAIPYKALVPAHTDGLLVCDKNLSVSHIANGATRLQPIVLLIGQAAGMAAALCVEHNIQPRSLPVRQLQTALLHDALAPAAVIPLFNGANHQPTWLTQQQYYLDHPEHYPIDGWDVRVAANLQPATRPLWTSHASQRSSYLSTDALPSESRDLSSLGASSASNYYCLKGTLERRADQTYILLPEADAPLSAPCPLVTLDPAVYDWLQQCSTGSVTVCGWWNSAGPWLRVNRATC
ncbi:MAG: FAD-dependent oxidoreductase [Cyanobacteria bacterium P01_D01_bin.128]